MLKPGVAKRSTIINDYGELAALQDFDLAHVRLGSLAAVSIRSTALARREARVAR
jgi:hypothetical protein